MLIDNVESNEPWWALLRAVILATEKTRGANAQSIRFDAMTETQRKGFVYERTQETSVYCTTLVRDEDYGSTRYGTAMMRSWKSTGSQIDVARWRKWSSCCAQRRRSKRRE